MKRAENLSTLKTTPVTTVLVVGAGINGAGTFHDLALNGVNTLLIDRADFCSGASAASSHMAHGGIRYLENGEFRLVREAVRERNQMIQNAPHLVKPLPTTIPIFKWFSGLLNAPLKFLNLLNKPSERGAIVIKLGLMFYDAFTGKQRTVPRHQMLNRSRSLLKWSRLHEKVRFTASYYDGLILSPERYTVELIMDAEATGPHARALNYVSLAGVDGKVVSLRDELTNETFKVVPDLIVNAAGPWIDAANGTMGLATRYIGGTKGSHLVLDHPELRAAIGENEFFFENQDGRIVLILPFYERVMVGTSDLPIENPDDAYCTTEEVDYFLEMIGRVFPTIRVNREHIVFSFSGVRPLAYSDAKTTGQITRDHTIQEDKVGEIPVFSLVGGKWTSYRAFSEEMANRILVLLGKPRKTFTHQVAIGGGKSYPHTDRHAWVSGVQEKTELDQEQIQTLFERYGTHAATIADFIAEDEDAPLQHCPGWSRREIEFLVRHEKVEHLDDLILRRSNLAMLGYVTHPLLEELAEIVGDLLHWDRIQKQAEVMRALDLMASQHGVQL